MKLKFNRQKLKALMRERDMTQSDLAIELTKMGLRTSRQGVSLWVVGVNGVSGATLHCLCKLFRVTTDVFYTKKGK